MIDNIKLIFKTIGLILFVVIFLVFPLFKIDIFEVSSPVALAMAIWIGSAMAMAMIDSEKKEKKHE